jgi:hypothetical protein
MTQLARLLTISPQLHQHEKLLTYQTTSQGLRKPSEQSVSDFLIQIRKNTLKKVPRKSCLCLLSSNSKQLGLGERGLPLGRRKGNKSQPWT